MCVRERDTHRETETERINIFCHLSKKTKQKKIHFFIKDQLLICCINIQVLRSCNELPPCPGHTLPLPDESWDRLQAAADPQWPLSPGTGRYREWLDGMLLQIAPAVFIAWRTQSLHCGALESLSQTKTSVLLNPYLDEINHKDPSTKSRTFLRKKFIEEQYRDTENNWCSFPSVTSPSAKPRHLSTAGAIQVVVFSLFIRLSDSLSTFSFGNREM